MGELYKDISVNAPSRMEKFYKYLKKYKATENLNSKEADHTVGDEQKI